VTLPSQTLNIESTSYWLMREGMVKLPGQFNVAGGGVVTVKVSLHVTVCKQVLVNVKIAVELPPQEGGAPQQLVWVTLPLHPPVIVELVNQALKVESIVLWLVHAGKVKLPGQTNEVDVAGVIVKVAEQVLVAWQVVPSVSVQITVVLPPQARGTPLPAVSALSVAPHPPL
jgi:hypothetical protein